MNTARRRMAVGVAVLVTVGAAAASGAAVADSGSGDDDVRIIKVKLTGYQEDPQALSTTGTGKFRLRVDETTQTLTYRLSYANLEGSVLQSHIHLGGTAQSGGISAFLCTNLGNGPAGTQACPPAPATISGTITAADIVGPASQGITAGQMAELIAAINADTTYVNVHSTLYPGGEIRSQLDDHEHDG